MTQFPKDWQTLRIADLGTVRGGRQRSPHYDGGRKRPYLRVANVFDGWIDSTDVLQMPFTDAEYHRYKLEPGDVLLNEGQSIELVGRSAIYGGDPPNCCFQNTLIRFRPGQKTDPTFAHALFEYLRIRGTFAAVAARTTSIAHLGVSRFASIRVTCPKNLSEQRAIGRVIVKWDAVLDKIEELLGAKRRFKRGLMQQLLTGKQRFKEFEREPWLDYHLGDVFRERVETGRPDLPLLSITADRGVVSRDELNRRDTSNTDKSKYRRIAPGDIGYNTMRMWQGVSALVALEGIVSPAYTVCEPGDQVHGPFAVYLFKLPKVVDLFRRHSQGLVDDTLNLKYRHFAQIRVQLPAVPEQQAIALDQQRRGVMELLLTGKVRVPV